MSIDVDGIFIFNPSGINASNAGAPPMSDSEFWTQASDSIVPNGFDVGLSGSTPTSVGYDYSSNLGWTNLSQSFMKLIQNSGGLDSDYRNMTPDQITAAIVAKELNEDQDQYETKVYEQGSDSSYSLVVDPVKKAAVEAQAALDAQPIIAQVQQANTLITLYNQTLDTFLSTHPSFNIGEDGNGVSNKYTLENAFWNLFYGDGNSVSEDQGTITAALSAVNAQVMGKMIADIGTTPSNYGITSDQYKSWMTTMQAAPLSMVTMIGSGMASNDNKLKDPYYQNFLGLINDYVSTQGDVVAPGIDNSNPLNALLGTYYTDTLAPQENQYGVEMKFLDPTHANIPPPLYNYFRNLTGVDLNSAANQTLYQNILHQYATDYGFTQDQITRILNAHEDPTSNDAWAQQMELRIQSQLIGNLIQDGEVSLSPQVLAGIMNKLPASVQTAITNFETKAGDFYTQYSNLAVSSQQLSDVVGAILVAAAGQVDASQSLINRVSSLNRTVSFNGVLILGSSAAIENIIHPVKATLMNFLAAVSAVVLDYRNAMLEMEMDDQRVQMALNNAQRSALEDKLGMLSEQIVLDQQDRINAAQEKQNQQDLGWGLIAAAILITILAIIISILTLGAGSGTLVGAFTTDAAAGSAAAGSAAGAAAGGASAGAAAGGAAAGGAAAGATAAGAAAASAGITGGLVGSVGALSATFGSVSAAVIASAGIGLGIAGMFQLLSANGINIGAMIMNALSSDAARNGLMAGMILSTIILAVLTAATLGALSELAATEGTIAASMATETIGGAAMSITSQIMNARMMTLLQNDFMSDGQSEDQAMISASIASAFINMGMMLASLAGGLGKAIMQARNAVIEEAADAAKSGASAAGESMAAKVLSNLLEMMKDSLMEIVNSVKAVVSSVKNSAMGITLLTLLKNLGAAFGNLESGILVGSQFLQMLVEMVSSILQGLYQEAEGNFLKAEAPIQQAQLIVQAALQLLTNVMNALPEDDQTMNQEIAQMGKMFQTLIADLETAVTAITSNTVAPVAAASSGSGAQNDTSDQNQQQKNTPTSVIEKFQAPTTASASIATISVTINEGTTSAEGPESNFMSSTSPQQMTALMALTRMLAGKIAQSLMQMGVSDPQLAEAQGMLMAGNFLKQLAAMSKNEIPLGKDAKETFGKNSVMATIAFLLGQKGLNQGEQNTLDDLFKGSTSGSDSFNDEQLQQLEGLLEQLATNDPNMESLLNGYKALMSQTLDPMEFSFKLVQLFAQAFGLGQANLSGLKSIFGNSMDVDYDIEQIESGSEDFSSLVGEYFSAPTSKESGSHSYA